MKSLYNYISTTLIFGLIITIFSCSDSLWDDLPEPVSNFITKYFPGQAIESEGWNDDSTIYTVKLRGSDMITFDKILSWRSVNGRGGTVPQMFLFDELPPALYEYLQAMETLKDVYRVERTDSSITVELLASTVIYDLKNGKITVPDSSDTILKMPVTNNQ